MVVTLALTQVQTTALLAQVIASALVGGLVLAVSKRRTEFVSIQGNFLVLALFLTVLVAPSAGWYALSMWVLFLAVQALPSALVGWLK